MNLFKTIKTLILITLCSQGLQASQAVETLQKLVDAKAALDTAMEYIKKAHEKIDEAIQGILQETAQVTKAVAAQRLAAWHKKAEEIETTIKESLIKQADIGPSDEEIPATWPELTRSAYTLAEKALDAIDELAQEEQKLIASGIIKESDKKAPQLKSNATSAYIRAKSYKLAFLKE